MKQNFWTFGVDEVGRGSLAGPVFLSGVFLPHTFPLQTFVKNPVDYANHGDYEPFKLVRDSKKLSAIKREQVSNLVISYDLFNSTLSASNKLIDNYGIGVCLSHLLAILVHQVNSFYSTSGAVTDFQIIVDGQIKLLESYENLLIEELFRENHITNIAIEDLSRLGKNGELDKKNFRLYRENYADDIYLSVALASNLAKVKRDTLMEKFSLEYPEFGWAKNKGYGTLFHRNAIAKNTQNIHLRQTFIQKIVEKS